MASYDVVASLLGITIFITILLCVLLPFLLLVRTVDTLHKGTRGQSIVVSVSVGDPVVKVPWVVRERHSCADGYWQIAFLHLQVRKNAQV